MKYQEPPTVAVVLNAEGNYHDRAWSWETGQTFAVQGHRVIAIMDDGHMSREDAQRLYDAEKERHDDCFGPLQPGLEIPRTTA